MATTMKYGTYSFRPVPMITLSKVDERRGDQKKIGTTFRITLDGTLTPLPTGTAGYPNVDALQDALRAALVEDGKYFEVKCDDAVLIQCNPRIIGQPDFPPSSNNWVMTSPYRVELEFDDEPTNSGENSGLMPPYIRSAEESWNVEFMEDKAYYNWELTGAVGDVSPYILRLTHNVGAIGKRHYTYDGDVGGTLDKEAWEYARDYVITLLGYDNTHITSSGVFNLNASLFSAYNHVRSINIREASGGYDVSESWLVINTGTGIAGTAIEDFTVSVRSNIDNALTSVSINGSIQGLEIRSYGSSPNDFTITKTKDTSAKEYWDVVEDKLFGRALKASEGIPYRSLNATPVVSDIGRNPSNGTINYTYEFNDRPCNLISSAKTENITISDNYPTDIFASIVIPGRARGPILQDISSITSPKRSVSIEALIQPPTGCDINDISVIRLSAPTTEVNALLCQLERELTNNYSQVFKTEDNASWNIKNGRYSRQVSWEYSNCSGTGVSTSFC